MGRILEVKNIDQNKIIANIAFRSSEYLKLNGRMEKIIIFSQENLKENSRLVQRGKKEATKYFLLPKNLRENIEPSLDVKCNRIDTPEKSLFVFEVKKEEYKKNNL